MTEYCDLCNKDITKPAAHFLSDCQYYRQPMKIGYHKAKISKGTFGQADKIKEECEEFMDAVDQNIKIMELAELSDMVGAIMGYLEENHPTVYLSDLTEMACVTHRAFKNGHRN